jgi:hypothetical protein
MVQLGEYVQIISAAIYAIALVMTILQFQHEKKHVYSEYLQYSFLQRRGRMTSTRLYRRRGFK